MNKENHYHTIEKESVAEFKDRGSKFLGFAFPIKSVEGFKKRLRNLKDEHPKAAHHCFAYRVGCDGNNFRSADDGEPAGSAGKPILGQIDSKKLTDTAIVVVRYFGGTLLGVPGLINAYKMVSSLALQLTPIIQKPIFISYQLEFDYTLMNDVMMILKRFNCVIIENEAQLFCRMKIAVPKADEELYFQKLIALHGLEMK